MNAWNGARAALFSFFTLAGGAFSAFFGGWSGSMTTLAIMMAGDYATGLLVAGVFHASRKTENGALESRVGWKGLLRKGVTLLVVLLAARLDVELGCSFLRDGVTTAYIANELLSIVENLGLMGVPMPSAISRAVELLKARSEEEK